MVDKKRDGCYNCKYLSFDFCEEIMEHVDMWFQENMGESMCNFDYWEEEE